MGDFLQGEFLRFYQPANPSHGLAIGHPDSSKQAGLSLLKTSRLAIGRGMGRIVLIVRKKGPNRPVGKSGIGEIGGRYGAGFVDEGYYSHVLRDFASPLAPGIYLLKPAGSGIVRNETRSLCLPSYMMTLPILSTDISLPFADITR